MIDRFYSHVENHVLPILCNISPSGCLLWCVINKELGWLAPGLDRYDILVTYRSLFKKFHSEFPVLGVFTRSRKCPGYLTLKNLERIERV